MNSTPRTYHKHKHSPLYIKGKLVSYQAKNRAPSAGNGWKHKGCFGSAKGKAQS